jgi:hypothetical protein
MSIRQPIFFYTTSGPATGLTPTWLRLVKQSDRTVATPQPTISEDANGLYYYDYDNGVKWDGVIDAGSASVINRYLPVSFGPDDAKLSIVDTPSGTYTITIQTRTSGAMPIAGVQVAVLNGSGQTVRTVTTDSNGNSSCSLDAGSFSTRAFKAMVDIVDQTFTVSGNATITLLGSEISISQPSAGCQTVWFIPDDPALTIDTSGAITAQIADANTYSGAAIITAKLLNATNATTRFEMQLAKGVKFRIIGRSTDGGLYLNKTITVTSDDTKTLSSYL